MQREKGVVEKHRVEADVEDSPSRWKFLPTEALVTIFSCLSHDDLCRSGQVCKQWSKVESLNYLWRRRFLLDFHPVQGIELSSGYSWKEEYKLLTDSVPCVEYRWIQTHCDEVLHVSFANDGTMFCTCSKDATVKVFDANEPFMILFDDDLGPSSLFRWSYTQFSQFNVLDTELLVSGRCDGSEIGEILVYKIDQGKFELQARIRIQPYDVMGTWLNESYILSSRCHHLPLRHCLSEVLLNKSSQEVHNLRQSIVKRLYMFKNEHANTVSYLKVADMTQVMSKLKKSVLSGDYIGDIHEMHLRILLQQAPRGEDLLQELTTTGKSSQTNVRQSLPNMQTIISTGRDGPIDFWPAPHAEQPLPDEYVPRFGKDKQSMESNSNCTLSRLIEGQSPSVKTEAPNDSGPMNYKVLLAFTGMDMNATHQIAMKFITEEKCDDVKHVDVERERRNVDALRANSAMAYRNITTDEWDHIIDVGGQLVGMEISPCGQYMFASYRKFSSNDDSSEQHHQLNISSTVTISVFDLLSMAELMVLNGPSAFSSVFYLYLSCAGKYLASGSEDNHGYLWNKHYGCLVSKFKHDDVVNCVAINPCDTTMAVSASDDHTIRIWRSKGFIRSRADSEASNKHGSTHA